MAVLIGDRVRLFTDDGPIGRVVESNGERVTLRFWDGRIATYPTAMVLEIRTVKDAVYIDKQRQLLKYAMQQAIGAADLELPDLHAVLSQIQQELVVGGYVK